MHKYTISLFFFFLREREFSIWDLSEIPALIFHLAAVVRNKSQKAPRNGSTMTKIKFKKRREFHRNKHKLMKIQEDECCPANQVIDWQEDQSTLLKSY